MKTTVIHHSADFDGLFCREIARRFLPDAELIGWDFGDPPLTPARILNDADSIYVLDLPIDRVFGISLPVGPAPIDYGNQLLSAIQRHIIWIDHHKSSIESHPTDIPGYRIDGVAACRLAWQWFSHSFNGPTTDKERSAHWNMWMAPKLEDFVGRSVSEPLAVRLAGEYDIWDKRDPRAELFQHGLRSRNLDGWWEHMLAGEDSKKITIEELERLIAAGVKVELKADGSTYKPGIAERMVENLIKRGEAIAYVRDQEYRDVITQQGFDVEFEGLKFLACNSHECDIRSQLFEAGIKPHHDGLIGFTFGGKDWRVSLYGVPGKPDIDLSPIAKKYGGGGHRQACGFRAKTLPFLK